MNDWKQTRSLIITQDAVYNFNDKTIKRKITIDSLRGMSKNITDDKKKMEFSLHVNGDYDYRFVSEKRDLIMKLICFLFANKKTDNLPVHELRMPNLKQFTTTERDFKKGTDLYPGPDYRNHEWDFMVFEKSNLTVPANSPEATPEVDLDELMGSIAVV